jgi:Transposase domain (DUF772)
MFADTDVAALFPACGQPGLPPWRLALVTILQFRENLADRQAAEAVRARIDWKYLLGDESNGSVRTVLPHPDRRGSRKAPSMPSSGIGRYDRFRGDHDQRQRSHMRR